MGVWCAMQRGGGIRFRKVVDCSGCSANCTDIELLSLVRAHDCRTTAVIDDCLISVYHASCMLLLLPLQPV